MLSIILPVYNDHHFLSTSLPSCLSQKIEKEVIVIDDASTKPISNEIQDLINSDPCIKYIRHEKNRGLAAARNTAISESKYPLVIPLDSDDHFYPNVLEQMVKQMGSEVDIVYGNVWDNYLHQPKPQPWTKETFKQDNPLFCSSLFRKEMFNKVGGYLEQPSPTYEDWRLWCQMWKAGAVFKYVPIIVYNHLSRIDGMLRKMHAQRDYYRKIATEVLDD